MLFSVSELNDLLNIQPKGVLHVGAHLAEESHDYQLHNWGKTYWVEAQPDKVHSMQKTLDPSINEVIHCVVWSESGIEMQFNLASNGESSSLLKFGSHSKTYPKIKYLEQIKVTTSTLAEVLPDNAQCDFLNLDLQGVELQALIGLGSKISNFKWIYTEVNNKEVYENCTLVNALDDHLNPLGFSRAYSRWVIGAGWGDALYVRDDQVKVSIMKIIMLRATPVVVYLRQCSSLGKKRVMNIFGVA